MNRPFDDHSQNKIKLESEAVLTILNYIFLKEWKMLGSEIIDFELKKHPNEEKKKKVIKFTELEEKKISINDSIIQRARKIEQLGLKSYDALHISCAEFGKADIFLTTDQEIIKKYQKNNQEFKILIKNPLMWLLEVL